ncbi:MAG: hypothetical protein ABI134_04935 [Byssovorax sp.]
MRCPPLDLLVALALASVVALHSTAARAEGIKEACVQAYEQAQRLRLAGDLLASRVELGVCSREVCPELVRRDCVTWIREVESATASVIVSARTPGDADRPDVRVFVDGALAQERLTGTAIEVNPGQRRFRLEPRGAPPVELPVLITTGEKNRLLRIVIPAETRALSSSRPSVPRVSIALGAFGIAAAGSGLALEIVGSAELGDLREGCAPRCEHADVDATRTKIIVGDALLGVGLLSLGAAVVYWLTRAEPSAPSVAQVFGPAPRAPFLVTF